MSKNLVIVESPAKAKTIEGYLGKDYIVKSSFGHIRDLPTSKIGVDVEKNFEPSYEISADKVKVINELKKLAKDAEVWLATDDDREGEAISWHLKEALGLPDTTKRIVFREITKNDIQKAITVPRTIDFDLVDAQQARRILDRLVGFELSPVLWTKIRSAERGSLSAGRVQSVAVRVIVDREREIDAFNSKATYKVVAQFAVEGNKVLNAEAPKNFEDEAGATAFVQKCVGADFSIKNLEVKPAKKSPTAPFTTSTLQQEASRKLGFSVLQTMTVAQKLYEAGHITYMRTDSTNLSQEAVDKAVAQIESAYGKKYVKTRQYKTKSETAQEAHEAIRPTDFSVQTAGNERNENRLYDLIWKRSIASQMADAEIERTIATIQISTTPQELVATGEVIKFDGFLKVYLESNDDEDEENKGMLPPLKISQLLPLNYLKATERYSKPAARYTEASLVKKLEELGIGRPSTYAPTISTIIKREYVVKEDRPGKERDIVEIMLQNNAISRKVLKENYGAEKAKLFPTHIGMIVNDFLVMNFDRVMDFEFTAKVEKEFDDVANGKLEWKSMIKNFYGDFHKRIEEVKEDKNAASGLTSRELGVHPESGKKVLVKLGKYGPYVQIGESTDEDKPTFVSLKPSQSMDSITMEEGLALFESPKLPREVGIIDGKPVVIGASKFGTYIKFGDKYVNLPKTEDPYTITIEQAAEHIANAAAASPPLGEFEGKEITVGKGRFGPYVKHDGKFFNIPKAQEPIDTAKAIALIEAKRVTETNKYLVEYPENPMVKVLNGRYGPYIAVGKRNIKIPKGTDAATLTLEECLKLAEL